MRLPTTLHASQGLEGSYARMKTAHGTGIVAAHPGPRTAHELLAWPRRSIELLMEHGELWDKLLANLTLGISMGTIYSGMMTPEMALSFLLQCMPPLLQYPAPLCAFACDVALGEQVVHKHFPASHQAEHYYTDRVDFLNAKAKAILKDVEKLGLANFETYERMGLEMETLERRGELLHWFTGDACQAWRALQHVLVELQRARPV